MMTFLPFSSFKESAEALDTKRLQNQRTEARFVIEHLEKRGFGGMGAYGAVRMWTGYRDAVAAYYNACLDAYEARGYKNGPTMGRAVVPSKVEMPPWLGDERFHAAQRAQLLLKAPDYYGSKDWDATPPELGPDYVYPKCAGDRWVLYRRARGKDTVLAVVHGELVAQAPAWAKRARAATAEEPAPKKTPTPTPSTRGSLGRVAKTSDASPRHDRAALVAEYSHLTKVALPALAKAEKWPIRFDHCFMRVMLDCAFGKCWYERLDRKKGSAISQIGDADLAAAVAIGRRMEAEGRRGVDELDARSLKMRGKRPKKTRS